MKKILIVLILCIFFTISACSGVLVGALKKSAEQGNLESQFNIGTLYANGKSVPVDYHQAIYWYKKAATQGHLDASAEIGFLYEFVLKDYEKSILWLEKSAKQGDSQYNDLIPILLGYKYYNGIGVTQDYEQAFNWLKKVYEKSPLSLQSHYRLGLMYYKGIGVTQDYEQAFNWFEKTAKNSNWYAIGSQYYLGLMYYNGQGITQNYKKAFSHFQKAAIRDSTSLPLQLKPKDKDGADANILPYINQIVSWNVKSTVNGIIESQYYSGLMYHHGQGITPNYEDAYAWYSIAAMQGHENAIKNRNIIEIKITPQQLNEAQKKAAFIQEKLIKLTKKI